MKKGIRCNETRNDTREARDMIRFEFLSDDGLIPSVCTVRLGDVDTVSGEPVTDVTIFREYYRLKDRQVRQNLKAERPERTDGEIARRNREKAALAEEFRRRWGYDPSADDLRYLLEDREVERWNLSLSVLVNEEDRDDCCRHVELSTPADMDEEVPVELQALRDVAASLSGRKAEVYEAMIQRAAGGRERLRFGDIAAKYEVSPKQINKDTERIKEMVRRRAEELRRREAEA